jgi:hypothetical protein
METCPKYNFPDILPALSFLDSGYRDDERLRREAMLFRT